MSELRWHPFLREWVITATHRQDRTFFPPEDYCPLCPTKPGGFPTEIPRERYDIAVFENKFPSLSTPPQLPAVDGLQMSPVEPSRGVCEVVCYTDVHDATLAELPLSQICKLTRVWRERYKQLTRRPDVEYVYIFENKGKEIGVTLTHPHGQIYAYPFIPTVIARRLEAERKHLEEHSEKLMSSFIREELADGRRVIREWDEWVAVIPFFARYPYEIHIAPRDASPDMAAMTDKQLDGMAAALKDAAQRLDRLFGFSMPYIMSLFQFPAEFSSFVIEITPPYRTKDKLKYLAGSEAGCGVFINDTLPEDKAAELRSIDL